MSLKIFGYALLLSLTLSTHGAYVTDQLAVGVYQQPNANSVPIRVITSGTALKVTEEQVGFLQVEMDDQVSGWIEARYVTEQKPAAILLTEAAERIHQARQTVDRLTQSRSAAENPLATLADSQTAELRQTLETSLRSLNALGQGHSEQTTDSSMLLTENLALKARLRQIADLLGKELPVTPQATDNKLFLLPLWQWLLLGGVTTTGFVGGVWFMDYLARRRHGGFRI